MADGTELTVGSSLRMPVSDEKRPAEDKRQGDCEGPPKKRKRKSTLRLLLDLLAKLAVIAVVVWGLLSFVLGLTIHFGNNMFPAIRDGDLVVAYRLQKPYLNAAVLYEHNGKLCLGRIVAMAGSEVSITEEGVLTVDDAVPAEEVFYPTFPSETAALEYPYAVGENKLFILNDFRSDTYDSRSFGAVDTGDVIGPVLLIMRRRGF